MIGVGALTLIMKHTLQLDLFVWKYHSACPDLLILTIVTSILKYVAFVFVGGSTLVNVVILGTD